MKLTRRHSMALAAGAAVLGAAPAWAGPADEIALAKQVEAFRQAQIKADAVAFEKLCAPELSYSHSDGRVEDKAAFVKNATAGKSKFNALDYKDVWMRTLGDTALVRFNWRAEQEAIADGKKTATNLHILMTWMKQGGEWKLLARSSTKL